MPLTAPSGSSITLLASPDVSSDGSIDVTAVVIEGGSTAGTGNNPGTVTPGAGTPVQDGTLVSFTTTIGHLQPSDAHTSAGKATVKYFADGGIGTATITAISGPASKTLALTVGSPVSHIVVTANPAALPSGGGSTVIAAQVQDGNGNGVKNATVTFTTTAGSLAPTFAGTDANGLAATTLTTTGAATVTATTAGGSTTGSAGATLTATVNVTIKTQLTVSITSPTSITVSVPATFAVSVAAATGAAPVKDVVIDFGDGNTQHLGQVSSATQATNLFSRAGATTVKVTATDTDGQTTTVSSPIVVAPLSVAPAANPTAVALGGSILFTVTTTTGALIDHYVYDFAEEGSVTSAANSQSHVFLTKGGHTATITVFPTVGSPVVVQVPIVIN